MRYVTDTALLLIYPYLPAHSLLHFSDVGFGKGVLGWLLFVVSSALHVIHHEICVSMGRSC